MCFVSAANCPAVNVANSQCINNNPACTGSYPNLLKITCNKDYYAIAAGANFFDAQCQLGGQWANVLTCEHGNVN